MSTASTPGAADGRERVGERGRAADGLGEALGRRAVHVADRHDPQLGRAGAMRRAWFVPIRPAPMIASPIRAAT